jgi:hypothetical protein
MPPIIDPLKKGVRTMTDETILKDATDTVRSCTWQRTVEMIGRIERKPGVTWQQVKKALDVLHGYVDYGDGTITNKKHEIIATFAHEDDESSDDDGSLTIGECEVSA